MRLQETAKLSEIIKLFVARQGLQIGIDIADMEKIFREIAGKTVSKYIKTVHFQGGCFYVALTSSVARQELEFLVEDLDLINKMNLELPSSHKITKIYFR